MNDKRKIKIGHSLEDLEQNIILTLQDQPILQGNELNQKMDILQNTEKREIQQAAHNAELRTKIKRLANASTSHLEAKNQGLSGILPHYDDYRFKSQTIQIEEGAFIKPRKPKKPKNIPNDFEVGENRVGAQFSINQRKHAKVDKNTQQKRNQLLQFLNETAQDKQQVQLPKREASELVEQSINQLKKKVKLQRQLKRQVMEESRVMKDDQDDLLLFKAIQRSNRARQENKKVDNGVKQILDILKNEEKPIEPKNFVEIQLNPVSFKLSDQNYQKKEYNINEAIKGTTSMMFVSLPSQRYTANLVKKQEELPQSFKQITPQELQKMKQQLQFMEDKSVGIGLTGTMEYLRQNSMIGKEEWAGRANDKIPQTSLNGQNDRIKLQYRNASGMLMKPKQAFRYICAAFHGEGPGKNKIEKRKKRQLRQLRMKQQGNSDGTLMKILLQNQEKTNEPFINLYFGSKEKKI